MFPGLGISPFLRGGSAPLVPSPLLTGLVASYSMEGNANDDLGVYNGTSTNVTYNSGNGKVLQGAGFGGTSFIEIASLLLSFIQNTSVYGISFFSKFDDYTAVSQYIMGNASGSNDKGFYIGTESAGRLNFAVFNGSGAATFGLDIGSIFPDNSWHHVVITSNGTNTFIYRNAILASTNGVPSVLASGVSTNGMKLGQINTFDSSRFVGDLDIVNFFDRFLTADDVGILYNMGTGLQHPFTSNNVYRITELNGDIAGMSAGDSSHIADLGGTKLGIFFGWEFGDTYMTNWWKSTDGGTTWTEEGALPYPSAHVNSIVTTEGKIRLWGIITEGVNAGDWFITDFDPDLETFTEIATGDGLPGEDAQLQYGVGQDLFILRWITNLQTDVYKWNGSAWAYDSTIPNNCYRSGEVVSGSTVRIFGGGLFDGSSNTVDMNPYVYVRVGSGAWTVEETLSAEMRSCWPTPIFHPSGDLFLLHGHNTEDGTDGKVFVKQSGTWRDTNFTALIGRHATHACTQGNYIKTANGYFNNDCFEIEEITI